MSQHNSRSQCDYDSGFSAGMIEGRKKGVEEAAKVAETCWPACDDPTDEPGASIRADASLTIAAAIRLVPTGDAEKGEAT